MQLKGSNEHHPFVISEIACLNQDIHDPLGIVGTYENVIAHTSRIQAPFAPRVKLRETGSEHRYYQ